MPHPVIEASNRFKKALLREDAKVLARLIDAYQRAFSRLQDKIDLLILEIGDKEPTLGRVVRMRRYRELMGQVANELQGFQAITANQIDIAAEIGIANGSNDARALMSYAASGTSELAAGFNRLPKDAIRELLGFLSPDGPLFRRLQELAPQTAQGVSDAIVNGVALGYNPRKIGAEITRAFGMGLTDSLRMTRTVQLWSYREANRATYLANADVVEGWYWHAELDSRTCMSCIAMHGKGPFPLTDPLNDHHNGRCAMIPAVVGFPKPFDEDGQSWFEQQDEATQRKLMGPGKFNAWKDGRFSLNSLSTTQDNDIYGPMRVEQTLKALVND